MWHSEHALYSLVCYLSRRYLLGADWHLQSGVSPIHGACSGTQHKEAPDQFICTDCDPQHGTVEMLQATPSLVLRCSDCSQLHHKDTIGYSAELFEVCHQKQDTWCCLDCKVCTVCKKDYTRDPDNEPELLLCDRCDDAIHATCANLDEPPAEYHCKNCKPRPCNTAVARAASRLPAPRSVSPASRTPIASASLHVRKGSSDRSPLSKSRGHRSRSRQGSPRSDKTHKAPGRYANQESCLEVEATGEVLTFRTQKAAAVYLDCSQKTLSGAKIGARSLKGHRPFDRPRSVPVVVVTEAIIKGQRIVQESFRSSVKSKKTSKKIISRRGGKRAADDTADRAGSRTPQMKRRICDPPVKKAKKPATSIASEGTAWQDRPRLSVQPGKRGKEAPVDPKYFLSQDGDLGYRSSLVSGSYANIDSNSGNMGPLLWTPPTGQLPPSYNAPRNVAVTQRNSWAGEGSSKPNAHNGAPTGVTGVQPDEPPLRQTVDKPSPAYCVPSDGSRFYGYDDSDGSNTDASEADAAIER